MKRTTIIAVLCFVLGFHASASEFSYDFSDVGEAGDTIPAIAVGDKLLLRGPDGVSLSLDIVSAPPAGIAGQSFIAKDAPRQTYDASPRWYDYRCRKRYRTPRSSS